MDGKYIYTKGCYALSVFVSLFIFIFSPNTSLAEKRFPFYASNDAIVYIRVVDASGNILMIGKGFIVDNEGLIATETGMIQKWFEEIQNDLIVRIKDKDFPIYRLIAFNKQLNIAVIKINSERLSDIAIPANERLARYIKKVIRVFREMVKDSKTIEKNEPHMLATQRTEKGEEQKASHFLRGLQLAASNRFKEAIEEYNKALKAEPFNPEIYYFLGLAYYKVDSYEKSIEAFNKALIYRPDSKDISERLGTLYLVTGQYEKAIDTYEKILRLYGNDAMTLFNHAIALFMKGDKDLAWQDYIVLRGINEELARRLWDLLN